MNDKILSPVGAARARRSKVLLGTALAVVLGGAAALNAPLFSNAPAFAQQVPASPVQSAVFPDFADLVQKVSPAVVSVRVRDDSPRTSSLDDLQGFGNLPPGLERFFRDFRNQMPNQGRPQQPRRSTGLGSGFFISDDGFLVTNNHVVDNASNFTVISQDGTEYKARLIGKDEKTDLALLKVDGEKKFPYVSFSKEPVRVGSWVLAVGNPFGLGGTVTAGIVSASGRQIGSGPYDDYIQIDAAVNRGNSGGPTFNLKGEVIGVNSAIYSPSGGNVGIAFAIPASTAQNVIDSLRDHGSVVRGWLGVQIQPVNPRLAQSLGLPRPQGALVAEPQADSPAVKAGVRAGDTILAVDGREVKDPRDLAIRIAGYTPNSTVKLSVWRDGARQEIDVKLGTMPGEDKQASVSPKANEAKPTSLASLGLTLQAAPDKGGVTIAKIEENSQAAESGLQEGDVILAVGSAKVASPADVEKQVADARKKGPNVLLRVKSGESTRFVAIGLDRG